MKLKLVTIDPVMADAFTKAFAFDSDVDVINRPFTSEIEFDFVISPGNSRGIMTGGFDKAIIEVLGEQAQRNIYNMIAERFYGCQPVGTAEIVPSRSYCFKRIVHVPTMPFPMRIQDPGIAYWSFYSAICAIINSHGQMNSDVVVATAMGGGTGGIPPILCAELMALAWSHFITTPLYGNDNWSSLQRRYNDITEILSEYRAF